MSNSTGDSPLHWDWKTWPATAGTISPVYLVVTEDYSEILSKSHNLADAVADAEQAAEENPGTEYVIVKSLKSVKAGKTVWTEHARPEIFPAIPGKPYTPSPWPNHPTYPSWEDFPLRVSGNGVADLKDGNIQYTVTNNFSD